MQKENLGNKVLSSYYKFGGWYLRLKAIGGIIGVIFGIIMIILGIYGFINNGQPANYLFIILGIIFIIGGIIVFLVLWWRSKSLVKGRFY